MTCRIDDSAHFHIRWSDRENLDWECFDTHEEAVRRAGEIALPGEIFRVEEVFAECPLREVKKKIARMKVSYAEVQPEIHRPGTDSCYEDS